MEFPDRILAAWNELKTSEPRIRTRDAAARLGCSEAELVAAGATGPATRLDPADLAGLLAELSANGELMWMTRNEAAVLEADAVLEVAGGGEVISVSNQHLRVELLAAAVGTVLYIEGEKDPPRSVHFYDPTGEALLKVFLKDPGRVSGLDDFARKRRLERQDAPAPDPSWRADPGFLPPMPGGLPLPGKAWRSILESAQQSNEQLRLHVSNAGCRQEVLHHPGRLAPLGPWFNILDDALNLHLNEERVAGSLLASGITHGERACHFLDAQGGTVLVLSMAADGPTALRLETESLS